MISYGTGGYPTSTSFFEREGDIHIDCWAAVLLRDEVVTLTFTCQLAQLQGGSLPFGRQDKEQARVQILAAMSKRLQRVQLLNDRLNKLQVGHYDTRVIEAKARQLV
jgi:hypothetical protein